MRIDMFLKIKTERTWRYLYRGYTDGPPPAYMTRTSWYYTYERLLKSYRELE